MPAHLDLPGFGQARVRPSDTIVKEGLPWFAQGIPPASRRSARLSFAPWGTPDNNDNGHPQGVVSTYFRVFFRPLPNLPKKYPFPDPPRGRQDIFGKG